MIARICGGLLALALVAASLCGPDGAARAQQAGSGGTSLSLVPAVVIVHTQFGRSTTQTLSLGNHTD